jgi:hypothetical protein
MLYLYKYKSQLSHLVILLLSIAIYFCRHIRVPTLFQPNKFFLIYRLRKVFISPPKIPTGGTLEQSAVVLCIMLRWALKYVGELRLH